MIKRLLRSVREYKRDSLLAPLMMVMEVAMECAIPFLMARLIDYGIDAGSMPDILKTGALLAAAAMLSLFFGAAAGKLAARASSGFAHNLRHDMYENVQRFSFANIDRFSTASLVTRLTTDVTNVQNAYQMAIRMACRAPMMLLFSLTMALNINRDLSAIFLGCIPVLGVGLYLIMSRVHPVFERVFRTYDRLNRVVQENLRGIRVVKAFVREEHEKQKFNGISDAIYKDFSWAERTLAFNMPLMQFCMYTCMLLLSWFGARLIVTTGGDPVTGFSTGQLMSLLSYTMQILMSLMMLSMVFVMMTISRASGERIVEVLEEKTSLESPENGVREVPNGAIAFEGVGFSYAGDERKLCLHDISVDIAAGETVGILGGTGSGKSTFAQLIPRLYDATRGRVLVGGRDVREYDLESLRNAVAMVLQKNVLFSGTVAENLRWGDEQAADGQLRHACELAQADGFIQDFPDGYQTHIEQGGTNVSGGQKQRLCIARALLKKPKILILDDSTSAVDTRTDALIRKALREELPGTTKLIIAQRVASVMDADKIIVLDGGGIAAMGTHETLMRESDIYREVYESQQKGDEADDA